MRFLPSLSEIIQLVDKYNWNVPRYTSYPPVPLWKGYVSPTTWIDNIIRYRDGMMQDGIAIYIHLPFCERLCTFCACNKYITTNHQNEEIYLRYLFREIDFYYGECGSLPVKHIYYGGGTPTFFSPDNLIKINKKIVERFRVLPDAFLCFEANPNYTTPEHIDAMVSYGFRRISFGIQELDARVAEAINRPTDVKKLEKLVLYARKRGYENINFDIIYGLPFQTEESILKTIDVLLRMEPDSITFYSYAHVPWKGKGQRKFKDEDLPPPHKKISIFYAGLEKLLENGYEWLGLDHFVLPRDRLFHAYKNGKLTRNFMGYTEKFSDVILAMGTSAISSTPTFYFQNHPVLEEYYNLCDREYIAPYRHYIMTPLDEMLRQEIITLMCYLECCVPSDLPQDAREGILRKLDDLSSDGLVQQENGKVKVTEKGRFFLRIIASSFDMYYSPEKTQGYSKAI